MFVQAVVKQLRHCPRHKCERWFVVTSFANSVGPGGLVFDSEPDPCTRSFLQHNVSRLQQVRVSVMAADIEKESGFGPPSN